MNPQLVFALEFYKKKVPPRGGGVVDGFPHPFTQVTVATPSPMLDECHMTI